MKEGTYQVKNYLRGVNIQGNYIFSLGLCLMSFVLVSVKEIMICKLFQRGQSQTVEF